VRLFTRFRERLSLTKAQVPAPRKTNHGIGWRVRTKRVTALYFGFQAWLGRLRRLAMPAKGSSTPRARSGTREFAQVCDERLILFYLGSTRKSYAPAGRVPIPRRGRPPDRA
jgi:hypothetical protein